MILIIESLSGDRNVYRISEPGDLRPVFERYPATKNIALYSTNLNNTLNNIADYLNNQHLTAWVESDLHKNVSHKIAALGMLAGSLFSSPMTSMGSDRNPAAEMQQAQKAPRNEAMGRHPADAFLWNIKQIESSGGKNVEHEPISHGQFKGEKAMGRWGLLQPTVKDILHRARSEGKLTPDMAALEYMNRDSAHKFLLKNPHTELKLARILAMHVLSRHGGDMQRAAYSWLNGHNLTSDKIHPDQLAASDYVQKFNKYNSINPYKNKLKPMLASKSMHLESKPVFKARLESWLANQSEQEYKRKRSTVFTNDKGRVREKELDNQDIVPTSAIEKLQHKLNQKKI